MRISLAIVDEVRPAVAEWLKGMSPSAILALRGAARLITHQAIVNMRGQLRRRTGKRIRPLIGSLKVQVVRTGPHPLAIISWASGLASAHEQGSTIPAVTIRPRQKKVLAWGGTPGGKDHLHFARFVHRRAFALRKRPMLAPAYHQQESAILALLEAEYQKVFAAGSTAAAIRERIGG